MSENATNGIVFEKILSQEMMLYAFFMHILMGIVTIGLRKPRRKLSRNLAENLKHMMDFTKILKNFTPPILLDCCQNHFGNYGFFGDYRTWAEALRDSKGYAAGEILKMTQESTLKVKQGKASYERDGVIFDKIQYSWPLLAGLLKAASFNSYLHVLDFGGAMGSSYYQNRRFFQGIRSLRWGIVEQPNIVECGKKYFEDEALHFYDDLQTCIEKEQVNVCVLSSVLAYLQKPHEILETLLNYNIQYIIIDRTPFLTKGDMDRLTVQKISSNIYPASYPAWFFNRDKFMRHFKDRYRVLAEFEGSDRANIPSEFSGIIFERHENKN